MSRNSSQINVLNLIAAIFLWTIVAAWTVIIFYLSHENAVDSYARSANLIVIFKKFNINFTEQMIRHLAIVAEYSFLSLAIYLGMSYTNGISEAYSYAASPNKVIKHTNELFILYSFWLSMFIAALTEYFQIFVEGREATIVDIGIAAGSTSVVMLICRVAFMIRLRIMNETEIEYE